MNVFVVHADGSVATPPISGSILEGVTRSSILRLLTDAGHEVSERQIPLDGAARGPRRRLGARGVRVRHGRRHDARSAGWPATTSTSRSATARPGRSPRASARSSPTSSTAAPTDRHGWLHRLRLMTLACGRRPHRGRERLRGSGAGGPRRDHGALGRVRPGGPAARHPPDAGLPGGDRERVQGDDRARGDEPGRGRHALARHDRALAAGHRPAADRRRRHRRAPARAHLGHRRLPRRGRRHPDQRVRDDGPGAATWPPRSSSWRSSTGSRPRSRRGEVLLLQRRVRGARPAGGAGVRGAVPRPRPPARLRARRPGRHRLPAVGRAARPRGARVRRDGRASGGPTCSTCRCSAPATAGSTPRARTCTGSGPRCSPARSSARRPWPRWCGRAARRRTTTGGTGSGSGCTRRATSSSSRATTPACRS